jgi:hypothetical protein
LNREIVGWERAEKNGMVSNLPARHSFVVCGVGFGAHNRAVQEFLDQNPTVRFHFNPDILLMAESGGTLVCKNPARCHRWRRLYSVADLSRKIRKYIRAYAKSAKPFRWTYTAPKHRIKVSE